MKKYTLILLALAACASVVQAQNVLGTRSLGVEGSYTKADVADVTVDYTTVELVYQQPLVPFWDVYGAVGWTTSSDDLFPGDVYNGRLGIRTYNEPFTWAKPFIQLEAGYLYYDQSNSEETWTALGALGIQFEVLNNLYVTPSVGWQYAFQSEVGTVVGTVDLDYQLSWVTLGLFYRYMDDRNVTTSHTGGVSLAVKF